MEEQIFKRVKDSKVSLCFSRVILCQAICCIVIILSIFIIKLFFKGSFYQLKDWYGKEVCADTHISEVLGDEA